MSWFPDLKNPIFYYIEVRPGAIVSEIARDFGTAATEVTEILDELLYERRIFWVETSKGFQYFAVPRPTAWEILLRDSFMV